MRRVAVVYSGWLLGKRAVGGTNKRQDFTTEIIAVMVQAFWRLPNYPPPVTALARILRHEVKSDSPWAPNGAIQ